MSPVSDYAWELLRWRQALHRHLGTPREDKGKQIPVIGKDHALYKRVTNVLHPCWCKINGEGRALPWGLRSPWLRMVWLSHDRGHNEEGLEFRKSFYRAYNLLDDYLNDAVEKIVETLMEEDAVGERN